MYLNSALALHLSIMQVQHSTGHKPYNDVCPVQNLSSGKIVQSWSTVHGFFRTVCCARSHGFITLIRSFWFISRFKGMNVALEFLVTHPKYCCGTSKRDQRANVV